MLSLRRYWEKRKTAAAPATRIEVLSFVRQAPGEKAHIHLRTDPDGNGLLLVNASRVMHLNASAAFMARLILQETPAPQAMRAITRRFRVLKRQAQEDYAQLNAQLDQLVRPDGLCPIHDLNLEIIPPFSAHPAAPYRMDLALTYRCNNDCAHCYNARSRDYSELSTAEWKAIIDRLWQTGIPHLVFTGGEPTLRQDLPELIYHAQSVGMVAGLNTNGRRLSDPAYLQQLVAAGLDHVQITLESHDPHIHDAMVNCNGAWRQTVAGLRNAQASPLYVMTNTTMLQRNTPYMAQTLDFLAELSVPTLGLNALIYAGNGARCGEGLEEAQLQPLLDLARRSTSDNGQRLIWYTPTQYCHFDPMELELGVKGCTAALYNMCIEPDGAVIPCQSYYQTLGYLMKDSWDSIWNHDLAHSLRQRRSVAPACRDCALLSECGGGCPLSAPPVHPE